MTWPDISFVVNKLSQFMHASFEHHWGAVKRLLCYLNGTRSLGIRLLVDTPLTLHGFFDVDWAGNQMIKSPRGLFLFSLVLIQFPSVLQINTLLLILPLRLSIVQF